MDPSGLIDPTHPYGRLPAPPPTGHATTFGMPGYFYTGPQGSQPPTVSGGYKPSPPWILPKYPPGTKPPKVITFLKKYLHSLLRGQMLLQLFKVKSYSLLSICQVLMFAMWGKSTKYELS